MDDDIKYLYLHLLRPKGKRPAFPKGNRNFTNANICKSIYTAKNIEVEIGGGLINVEIDGPYTTRKILFPEYLW
jgi:hypothetical protein